MELSHFKKFRKNKREKDVEFILAILIIIQSCLSSLHKVISKLLGPVTTFALLSLVLSCSVCIHFIQLCHLVLRLTGSHLVCIYMSEVVLVVSVIFCLHNMAVTSNVICLAH